MPKSTQQMNSSSTRQGKHRVTNNPRRVDSKGQRRPHFALTVITILALKEISAPLVAI